jgi:heme oxygenase
MLREALRDSTRVQHARLEERVAIERRVRDRAAYVDLLKRFHGFYVPVEERLAGFADAFWVNGIDLEERLKARKLKGDLCAFGEPASTPANAELVPAMTTFSCAVGCLYVLEGSTLGGQIIMRHVRESLSLDAATGAAFFSGYGPRTGSMWQAFLKFLGALPFDEQERAQAIGAARQTFESLERWLCER